MKENVAIAYRDLDQGRYFVKEAGITTDRQWIRAVDQHLVPNRPRGPDRFDLTTFSLGPRSGRYLTVKTWMHCAVAVFAQRHDRRNPSLVAKVREAIFGGRIMRTLPGPPGRGR